MGRRKKPAPGFVVTPQPQSESDGKQRDMSEFAEEVLEDTEDESERAPEAKIERLDPLSNQYAVLDTVDAALVTPAWIRDNYGGGTFRKSVYGTREDGSWGYVKGQKRVIRVDSSIPFKGPLRDRAALVVKNGDAPVTGGSLIDMGMIQLLRGMQDNSNTQAQMARDHSAAMMAMVERMAAPRGEAAKPTDWAQVLPGLASLIASLAGLFGGKGDPVAIATQIATLIKSNDHGSGGVKETLGAVRELIEMRELLGPGTNSEDSEGRWLGILEKALPGVIDVLKAESQRTGQPIETIARGARPGAAPRLSAPSTSGTTPAPTASTEPSSTLPPSSASPMTTPQVTDEWTPLEPYMVQLAGLAAQNKEPYSVMHMIKAVAAPSMLAAVRELVAKEDAPQVLLARFPVLQPHAAWLEQLLEEFYTDIYGEEEPGEPGEEPPAADTAEPPAT
jgi:hypothetical protein